MICMHLKKYIITPNICSFQSNRSNLFYLQRQIYNYCRRSRNYTKCFPLRKSLPQRFRFYRRYCKP
jgi:hypothetical protein